MTTNLKKLIRDYPDFPKKGIIFKDILPILQRPEDFSELIKKMSKNQMCSEAEAIISIDARGFIFGTALSFFTSKPMIVARKPGKLPGDLISKSYLLEYGENSLSILTSKIIDIKEIKKDDLSSMINEANEALKDENLDDQKRFLANQKIDVLNRLN